jgi:hypothetical protein
VATSVCIIVSVLEFVERPLSYTAVRSVFTPEERLEQTARSIGSARERLPGTQVILAEFGANRRLAESLAPEVDELMYLGDLRAVRWAVGSRWKGLGEVVGLLAALRRIGEHERYYKLAGRYWLTDDFDASLWNGDGFAFRDYGSAVSTRFYSVSASQLPVWRRALRRSTPYLFAGKGIEDALARLIPGDRIRRVPEIGLAGWAAAVGTLLEE